MKKLGFVLVLFFAFQFHQAQELLANVIVDYSQVQTSNTQIYQTLEQSLKDFINNTKFTDKTYKPEEKIECTFSIIILGKEGANDYKATLTVQSRRPVYNSDYNTTILNILDPNFNFKYTQFETLIFNPRRFSGKNLTDVIGFYIYLILGYDADTFAPNGGTEYFNIADKLVDVSVNQGYKGWDAFDGLKSRALFIGDILKPQSNTLRNVYYQYHRNGLDKFYNQELFAKNTIANSLLKLKQYENNTLFYPLEVLLFSKKEEIASIYSDGMNTKTDVSKVKEVLTSVSPKFSEEYWSKIKQ